MPDPRKPGLVSAVEIEKVLEAEADLARKARENIDQASNEEIRALLKELLLKEQKKEPEPLGIDIYADLPIFMDRPECPRCLPFNEAQLNPETGLRHNVCHDCKGFIPYSLEFQNHGIESVTADHIHLHTQVIGTGSGRPGQIRVPARRELCLPCFRADWTKKNPDKPCDI